MRILVLHRITNRLVRYPDGIDHDRHDVTYVGTADRLDLLPQGLRCKRIERPGTGDTTEEVLAAVADLPRPDLVVALSEYDLVVGARVRAALGVPGDSEADVLLVRDKVAMKGAVERAGLRVPRFLPLEPLLAGEVDAPWSGPTIVKPVDGAGSEHVLRHDSLTAALAHVRTHGLPTGTVAASYEVEEFVEGPIIHVDGFVVDGAVAAIQASRYVGTCLGYAGGEPLGSVQTETGPELVGWALACLAAVGIRTGLFHLEGIAAAGGLVFLEVGARFGGADVVDTFELATGLHLPSGYLRHLVDGTLPQVPEAAGRDRYGWYIWPGHQLRSAYCDVVGVERFRDHPYSYRWVQRAPGEPVKETVSFSDTDVPLAGIVGPGTTDGLDRHLRAMFTTISVTAATRSTDEVLQPA